MSSSGDNEGLTTPFEVWYATPGNTEVEASQNDHNVRFTRAFNYDERYGGVNVRAEFVGFVGKVNDERNGEGLFYVERNVIDGSCL